jgi:hypothetical protein
MMHHPTQLLLLLLALLSLLLLPRLRIWVLTGGQLQDVGV